MPCYSRYRRTGVRGRSILVAVCVFYTALCFQVACAAASEAQTQTAEVPSRQIPHARDLAQTYPSDAVLELPELSKAEEKQVMDLIGNTSKFYTGINRPVSVAAGNWRRVGERNGFSIWQLHVRSPGAKGVKVWFSEFDLPDGMTVKVYGSRGHPFINEYAGKGLFDSTRFWSLLIPGDTLIVEVWSVSGGALSPADFPFEIPWLDHHFRSGANNVQQLKHYSMDAARSSHGCPFRNGSFQDGECILDDPELAKGIAKINYTPPPGEGSGGQCTGGILDSESPAENGFYLMTAYHCIEDGSHPEMAIGTGINLSIVIGDSACIPTNQKITGQGASFIAGGEASDHALLWVESSVLSSSDFYRFDWTTQSLPRGRYLETLHHAEGTRQNYAKGIIKGLDNVIAADASSFSYRSCTDSGDFYCSHYDVDFERGEGGIGSGASGAPVATGTAPVQVNGIVSSSDSSQCLASISRFTRVFEDERVSCALEDDPDGGAGSCANRLRLRFMPAPVLRLEASPETAIPDNTDNQSVRSTISVDEDVTIESLLVSVSITHTYNVDLKIELITPGGESVVLHERQEGEYGSLRMAYTSASHKGLKGLVGKAARGEWTLTVGDYARRDVGTLDMWNLEFGGGDDPLEEARVPAGGVTRVTVVLENFGLLKQLPELERRRDEEIEVSLSPETVSVYGTTLTFTAAAPSTQVFVRAPHDMLSGELVVSGRVFLNGRLTRATVEPATLPVEIVPREFTLAFAAPGGEILQEAQILAGGSTSFRLIVSGTQTPLGVSRLFADETLTVGFAYDGEAGVTLPPPVSLTPDEASSRIETPVTFTVAPDAVGGTLTVSGHGPVNATVEPATLPVEIVPREFRLALAAPGGETLRKARMLAGGSTSFRLIISGTQTPLGVSRLFAGETFTVGFAYDGGAGVTPPPPVSLTPNEASSRIETVVTFTVAPNAVDGTLTVSMSGHGPVNATVTPATLPVEIVPREFRLAFAATPQGEALQEYQLAASGETPVWVRLLGVESSLGVPSLGADETLTAELAYTGGAGMKVSPSMLEFAGGISEIEVMLSATLSAQASALVASADSAANSADLPNVTAVEPATLRVVIVPRQFELVFTPKKIVIGTSKTRTVRLLLIAPDMQSRLADEERLEASLARVGGNLPSTVITLVPTTVAFTRDSAVTTLTVETTIEIEGSEEGSEAIWEATAFTVLERTQDIDPARFAAIFRTKALLRVRVLLEGPLQ